MPKNILIALLFILGTLTLTSCGNPPQFLQQITQSRQTQPAPTQAQLSDDMFWQANPNEIWDRLQHTSLHQLESAATSPNPIQAAWIKLAIISKRYSSDSKQLGEQLITWRNENSGHPGNVLLPTNSILNALAIPTPPKHIALLLPLKGSLAASGQAVRDGFLSAYYASFAKTHLQQTISFYDTSATPNIAILYQEAVTQGADIVIGPLSKENVQTLLSAGTFTIPTLALNYTDSWFSALPANFYEFGLSPVDEAQQVADKAWQSGTSRAIVIAPQNEWGQHTAKALISRWQSIGGSISDTLYFSSQTDLTTAIPDLLHINTKADREKMKIKNNKNNLEAQRRQDFNVIFLLAEPPTARQIVPLLKYYYADNIPIYSTSVIYSGVPSPQKDNDLNGIIFCDIPGILKNTIYTNRLYAVGHDAYQISGQLQRLINLPYFPMYATTGALTLLPTQQFYRRLPWATMHDGHP